MLAWRAETHLTVRADPGKDKMRIGEGGGMRVQLLAKMLGLLTLAVIVAAAPAVRAEPPVSLFRIGTGGTGGTYYPVGQALAHAISNPTAATVCAPVPCGVPGLLAVAQTANGSVSNIEDVQSRKIESGFTQSDVAYWALSGSNVFEAAGPQRDIRGIASLYHEDIHVVARKGSGISRITDLRGKRVSLDDPGSGTLVGARIILNAYGLTEDDLEAQYIKAGDSIKKIREGKLDAFFIIAGNPSRAISELSEEGLVTLIPISGPIASRLTWENPFFTPSIIPAGSYAGVEAVRTLGVAALWVVSSAQSDVQVYEITKRFWENLPDLKKLGLHPKIDRITMATAFFSMSVPLHPGALKYYQESGLLLADSKNNKRTD
tara:strand:+ start:732 stop:1859 length:1128 start_codon:yes stop_codon:yes gene_type:complete